MKIPTQLRLLLVGTALGLCLYFVKPLAMQWLVGLLHVPALQSRPFFTIAMYAVMELALFTLQAAVWAFVLRKLNTTKQAGLVAASSLAITAAIISIPDIVLFVAPLVSMRASGFLSQPAVSTIIGTIVTPLIAYGLRRAPNLRAIQGLWVATGVLAVLPVASSVFVLAMFARSDWSHLF